MSSVTDLIRFFQSGGIFMFPLLIILAIGSAIVIERILILKKSGMNSVACWKRLQPLLGNHQFDDALKLTSGSRPLQHVLYSGIIGLRAKRDREEIQGILDESTMEVLPRLEARLHYLPNLANVATLVGLLGTIMGLIDAFTAVGAADPSQKAVLLAKGISVAMNTTAFGLVVAIPLMLIYTYLQAWTNRLIDSLDEYGLKLLNLSTSAASASSTMPPRATVARTETPRPESRGWGVDPTEGLGHAK